MAAIEETDRVCAAARWLLTIDEMRYRLRVGGTEEDPAKLALLLSEIDEYRDAERQADMTMEHTILSMGRDIAEGTRRAYRESERLLLTQTMAGSAFVANLFPVERAVARAFMSVVNARLAYQKHRRFMQGVLEGEARRVAGEQLWSLCEEQVKNEEREEEEAAASRATAKGDECCCICLDASATCRILPCGHQCLCVECSKAFYSDPLRPPACPICRGESSRRPKMYTGTRAVAKSVCGPSPQRGVKRRSLRSTPSRKAKRERVLIS
jgi:hypothetical protein